ncbi:MAG: DNA polymerase I [Thermoflexaceae bacterium]|nr:DNA polymerase I [Thermoflexaceae bacterium]
MEKIVLIDGHSILNRAFYGIPDLTNSEGVHTNAVYGFLNIMLKILDEEKPDYLTVAFDVKAPTFRHKMYAEYKGTRKPMPKELHEQVPVIKEVLSSMGIPIVEMAGYEADDLLGTIGRISEEAGLLVSIVSGDRDLLQLATEKVQIRIPKTKKGTTEIENYYAKDVKTAYQVTPTEFIDLKALMGDTADNIPGAPGIGEKTAAAIIGTYHSVENALEHVEEITPNKARTSLMENREIVELSKVLATINVHAPVSFDFEAARIGNLFTDAAYELFKKYEFKSLLKKFSTEKKTDLNEIFNKYRVIEDFNEVLDYFDKMSKKLIKKHFSFEFVMEENHVAGLLIMAGEEEIVYIPAENFVTEEMLSARVKELAKSSKKAVTMDLKAALPKLSDIVVSDYFDIKVAAYLLNPLKDTYNYDDIARDYLQMLIPSQSELVKSDGYDRVSKELQPLVLNVYFAYQAYEGLKQALEKEGMFSLYNEIELPLIVVLYDMERFGMKVDKDALKVYGEHLSVRIKELEKQIFESAGVEFNINSPKQLGEVLFDKLGLKGGKKTKTGYSTSAEVLEKIKDEHPVIPAILEYRQLTKLKSTYADGLAVCIGSDNRIHSKFNQTITATGRISSTEPNLQNIPVRMELGRQIRKVFVPEEDYVFVDADYSQIELRILAHMSGDEKLIEAYQGEQDIHKITASQVFHVPLSEVTPQLRRNAKAVNFGIVYGISSFGLSQDLSISRKEAAEYIERYFETYPGIKKYLDGLVESAKEKGYAVTMYGRKRPVPEISSSNFMQRSFGERIAMNSPIQGTAADIIKLAMIRVSDRMKQKKLKSRLVLQVHDELLIECHKTEIDMVKEILQEEMMKAAVLSVPLEVDMHVGNDWFEAK